MTTLRAALVIAVTAVSANIWAETSTDAAATLEKAKNVFQPLPKSAQLESANPDTTPALVKLGHELYFDPRLSKNGNVSCNSCHNLATYGVDNLPKSLGTDAKPGGRNPPTTLNAALNTTQFWDGRAQDVEEQAGGPLLNPVEMGLADEAEAVKRVSEIPGYVESFKDIFGDKDPVTFKHITQAIGAYERTLITPSPFDRFLQGDTDALSPTQLAGLNKFMDYGCIACHSGVNLGGGQFQKFGLVDGPYWKFTGAEEHDEGRFEVTKAENDKFLFRVPTLRNVEYTYPYFHDGSVKSLHRAVKIMGMAQLGRELPEKDIDDIVAFLNSLTGEVSEQARVIPLLPKSVFEKYPQTK
ncbi:cytochrome-c peroxidase [Suttonella ornithocola]|uniref:Cytochrome c551 peroxidase n=1 Tax=Suttonella ornithocola TaxID=279832 RepID=A0A380MLW9_9GAMM|nr:cytochrome-c peroxidase [Suttonella ornithocola]SUO93619.1 Cytochrome c551 peroxidase precursor [Suttonella ornithocola]